MKPKQTIKHSISCHWPWICAKHIFISINTHTHTHTHFFFTLLPPFPFFLFFSSFSRSVFCLLSFFFLILCFFLFLLISFFFLSFFPIFMIYYFLFTSLLTIFISILKNNEIVSFNRVTYKKVSVASVDSIFFQMQSGVLYVKWNSSAKTSFLCKSLTRIRVPN